MSYLKCTCQQQNYNYRNTEQKQRQFTEDPALLEKLRERQLELEELNLEVEHNLTNLNRENDLLQEKIKLENQEYRDCQGMRNNITVEMRNYKLLSYKKSQELQMLIQNVHELEAEKKMSQNEAEYLRQLLLHDNENKQQLQKKEEHIKLLENRLKDLEQNILQSKRNIISIVKYLCVRLIIKFQFSTKLLIHDYIFFIMDINIFQKEIQAISNLEQQYNFKNKNTYEILQLLGNSLNDQQKQTINQLSQLDSEMEEIVKSIDKLDQKYADFESIIDIHQDQLNTLSKNSQNVDSYLNLMNIRKNNENKLNEFCAQK